MKYLQGGQSRGSSIPPSSTGVPPMTAGPFQMYYCSLHMTRPLTHHLFLKEYWFFTLTICSPLTTHTPGLYAICCNPKYIQNYSLLDYIGRLYPDDVEDLSTNHRSQPSVLYINTDLLHSDRLSIQTGLKHNDFTLHFVYIFHN